MDFGEAKYILSGSLNTRVLIINSERHDGYTFKFCKKNRDKILVHFLQSSREKSNNNSEKWDVF